MAQTKPGAKLYSVACETEVMVIKGSGDLDLCCGGVQMAVNPGVTRVNGSPGLDAGSLIGKRYVDSTGAVEVLCTKPGSGSLSVGDEALTIKQAQALPSSD